MVTLVYKHDLGVAEGIGQRDRYQLLNNKRTKAVTYSTLILTIMIVEAKRLAPVTKRLAPVTLACESEVSEETRSDISIMTPCDNSRRPTSKNRKESDDQTIIWKGFGARYSTFGAR